jgi:hypothetical protein
LTGMRPLGAVLCQPNYWGPNEAMPLGRTPKLCTPKQISNCHKYGEESTYYEIIVKYSKNIDKID